MKKVCIYLCMLCTLLMGKAIANAADFHHYTIHDGLSNSSVRSIFQDKDGFLWIGTLNGLNRFDGYHFKEYHYVPGDTNSLSTNRINNIMQDGNGIFYIVSFDGAIHRFSPANDVFTPLRKHSFLGKTNFNCLYYTQTSANVFWFLSSNNGCARLISDETLPNGFIIEHLNRQHYHAGDTVNFVFKPDDQQIWIGTSQGLVNIRNERGEFNASNLRTFHNTKNTSFTSVVQSDNKLWFGTSNLGVIVYDMANQSFAPSTPELSSVKEVLSISSWDEKYILIGTRNSGLMVYNIAQNRMTQFDMAGSNINSNTISTIYRDEKGLFWLISDKRGVTSFDVITGGVNYFPLRASDRESLADTDKQFFYKDSNGDLWIGLYGGGMCKYNRATNSFTQYLTDPNNPYSLLSNYVLALFEDRTKNLWIGTYNGGLDKLNIKPSSFESHILFPDELTGLSNEVRSMIQCRDNSLIFGTKGGTLHIVSSLHSKQDRILIRLKKSIYALFEDSDNNLWIGTKGDGIYIIKNSEREKLSPKLIHISQPMDSEFSTNSNNIFAINQDVYGNYWIGTYGGGLYILKDPFHQPQTISYAFDANNPHSISDNRIRNLYFDNANNLWIGTSGGLNVLPAGEVNQTDKHFIRITCEPGNINSISNNDILCIAQHTNGKLMVGTFGGGLNLLEKVDLQNKIFNWRFIMKSNGLSSNVIESIREDHTGLVWLGTDNGLNMFHPGDESIELFFENEGLGSNIFAESSCIKTRSGEMIFGHNKGLVQFNPMKIRKDTSQYNIFLTRLVINNKEMLIDQSPAILNLEYLQNNITFEFSVLDFTSPDKNRYSFCLENFDQEWSKPAVQNHVTYRGLPPGEYTFKIRGTNSDGIWMKSCASYSFVIRPPFWNSPLGYTLIALIFISIVLFIYYLQINQMKLKHELHYNEQINEHKLQYYTNISHEFKTPLALILNPAEEIIENKHTSESTREKAIQIRKNSLYLLHLIEQILDFRKIREDKSILQVSQIQLEDFFREIYMVFLPLANKKEIKLVLNSDLGEAKGFIDVSYLEKICFNLLSNAIKFTPRKKKIEVNVALDSNKERMILKVADEGIGIQPKELHRIFDRFYRSNDSSGIGLFFTREMVVHHKGEITVNSEINVGSTFVVNIPVDKKFYHSDEIIFSFSDKKIHLKSVEELDILTSDNSKRSDPETVNARYSDHSNKDTILIIEDNDNMLSYLSEKLSSKYSVLCANNGRTGLKLATQHSIDLIICDYMMPDLDGIETLKKLKTDFSTSHVPVILLTAISDEARINEALTHGADDYITKPFNMNYLKIRIDNLISQRKKLKQSFASEPEFSSQELPVHHADSDFIEKVTAIIDKNIANVSFNVDYIADNLKLSRTVFYKKMKTATGYSPNEFIQLIRMKKAAHMIKNSSLTVNEICIKVGFSDANYFSKCFKNHYGVPPSVYQRQK